MKIKQKLSLVFLAFVMIFVILGVAANHFFLEDFYMKRIEKQFYKMHESIEREYEIICKNEKEEFIDEDDSTYDNSVFKWEKDKSEKDTRSVKDNNLIRLEQVAQSRTEVRIQEYIRSLEHDKDVRTILLDQQLKIHASSFNIRSEYSNAPMQKVCRILSKNSEWMSQKHVFLTYERKNEAASLVVYIARFPNQQILIIYKPVKGIRDNIHIFNQFILYVGLVMMAVGIGVGTWIAKYVTKPIILMSEITADMAELDFSKHIQTNRKDEIGILGAGINEMSVKLSKSIEALQNDVDRQKSYVRNLSHELKTPIAVIKGYADGLQYGVADDVEKQKKYSKVIADECARMNRLVQKLLELSLLEQDKLDLKREYFSIDELVCKAVERFQPVIQEKQVECMIECDSKISILGNASLMESAIENLVSNAVKYVNIQGKVTIRVITTGTKAIFSIRNTGSHVGEEHLSQIWDVFYKEDKARSRSLGGHGIGLSIVKKVIELHEGTVYGNNTADGVEFGFFLPLKNQEK